LAELLGYGSVMIEDVSCDEYVCVVCCKTGDLLDPMRFAVSETG
jgi:hypothetical protein